MRGIWTSSLHNAGTVLPSFKSFRQLRDTLLGVNRRPANWFTPPSSVQHNTSLSPRIRGVDVMVVGSVALDTCCDYAPLKNTPVVSSVSPQLGTSNPSVITQAVGGVGHNVAYAAHLLGASVQLCSVVADDFSGEVILQKLRNEGLSVRGVRMLKAERGTRSAGYIAFNDSNKNLVMAMADMSILDAAGNGYEFVYEPSIRNVHPKWLVIDANWDSTTLRNWACAGKAAKCGVVLEPVSTAKAARIFSRSDASVKPLQTFPHHVVDLATPNAMELAAMYEAAQKNDLFEQPDWWRVLDSFGLPMDGATQRLTAVSNSSLVDRGIPQQSMKLLPFIPCILTKLGSEGVLLAQLLRRGDPRLQSARHAQYIVSRNTAETGDVGGVYMRLFRPARELDGTDVVSVNGVGDTFLGVMMAGIARSGIDWLDELIPIAQEGSVMTLRSREAVHPLLGLLRRKLLAEASKIQHVDNA